jgi:IS30 family transposase
MADHDVARLRALGFSFRAIAGELGLSLGGVQRELRRAGVRPGQPAAQVVGDREGRISELFDALYDEDGSVNELTLHRLRYWLAPPDYELLCERVGRPGRSPRC